MMTLDEMAAERQCTRTKAEARDSGRRERAVLPDDRMPYPQPGVQGDGALA